jgi:hypothetical protein
MKQFIFLSVLFFTSHLTFSQGFDYSRRTSWSEKPSLHEVNKNFDSAGAVGILDERSIEYKAEGDDIFIYHTVHNIIKIRSDKGIEMYNKVYVYIYPNSEVKSIKARTILPNGKIINVDADKIKEIEEEGRKYKLFAMEGVEKNAEVEYTYEIKRPFALFSSEIFQEENVPYQQEFFTLIVPAHLKFTAKGYNGFKVSEDSLIDDKRIIVGYDTDVQQLEDEKYAYRDQYLKRVDYKLSYNLSGSSSVRLYTWKELAKKAFAYYTERSEKENKALETFAKQIKVDAKADDASKIILIEDHVKNNINIDKKLISQDADAIEKIVKNKASNDEGVVKLIVGLLDKFNIAYQIVYASDRGSFPLDEELENWNRANDVLLYFPSTNKYIAPATVELRYPYIPYNLAASRGLFLKGTVIGNFKTAVGTFGDIAMEPYEQHAQNAEADIRFDENLDTLLINSKQILKGYGATVYRPIYVFLPKDKQDEINKEIIKSVAGSTNISNIKIENTRLIDCADNKPLIIAADIKSTELLENAGNKILLKIGEVIGQQVQMYQEKSRQMPVELSYPHVLERKVTLHIPDGYNVKNLDDLNFNIAHKEGEETTMGFVSTYTQTGNTVNILITESYKRIRYPLEQFDDFKKVINAAADFNKVVLVLEKRS